MKFLPNIEPNHLTATLFSRCFTSHFVFATTESTSFTPVSWYFTKAGPGVTAIPSAERFVKQCYKCKETHFFGPRSPIQSNQIIHHGLVIQNTTTSFQKEVQCTVHLWSCRWFLYLNHRLVLFMSFKLFLPKRHLFSMGQEEIQWQFLWSLLFNIRSSQLLPVYLADISVTCEFERAMVEPVKEACTTKDATCPFIALVCVKRETILQRQKGECWEVYYLEMSNWKWGWRQGSLALLYVYCMQLAVI